MSRTRLCYKINSNSEVAADAQEDGEFGDDGAWVSMRVRGECEGVNEALRLQFIELAED